VTTKIIPLESGSTERKSMQIRSIDPLLVVWC